MKKKQMKKDIKYLLEMDKINERRHEAIKGIMNEIIRDVNKLLLDSKKAEVNEHKTG